MQESLRDRISKEIQALSTEGGNLVALLFSAKDAKAKKAFDHYGFSSKYQQWYTRALRVVTTLAPDRLREFVSYYEVDPKRKAIDITSYRIQDFLNGFAPTANRYTGEIPYVMRDVVDSVDFS